MTRQGRPVLPHAMLYALVAVGKLRRIVVGSSNFSVEALGQFVRDRYETYSFEAGVALSPLDDSPSASWLVVELAPEGGLGPAVEREVLWTTDPESTRFSQFRR